MRNSDFKIGRFDWKGNVTRELIGGVEFVGYECSKMGTLVSQY